MTPQQTEMTRIEAAEVEAKRFLARAAAYRAAAKQDDGPFPKQSGAVKRASMDLTRALADVRRSLY